MIEPAARRRLAGQTLYALLMLGLLFLKLVPLHPGRVAWPGPDLPLALTFAWVLRRPEQVPVLLIAAAFLTEDLLTLRPIGLWTAIVVLGTEAARLREPRWRDAPFMVEWLRVSALIVGMTIGTRIVMAIFLLPLAPAGQSMLQGVATVAAYPLVVLAGHLALGLRRPSAAEADGPGFR